MKLAILVLGLLILPAWSRYPPVIEEARVETYREEGQLELKAWIVGEAVKGKPKPAIVLFFGGGWRFGSPDSLLKHARFFSDRGMICILADYRVSNRNGSTILDSVDDAKAAFAWTRKNAQRLGIDTTKIAAGGASAGGHLAACIALLTEGEPAEGPDALLLFNPALLLAPFEGQKFGYSRPMSRGFVGAEPESLSPIHHVDAGAPPTWIAHGERDNIVPVATAQAFQEEMLAKGRVCELFIAPGQPHAFHYRDPAFSEVMASAETFLQELGWLKESSAPNE